jgi:phosphatidylglycerophosphatase A
VSSEPRIDRRALKWDAVRGPIPWLAVLTGTFFGSGLLPKAPGTWGTLAAMPLCWWLAPESLAVKLVVWTILLAAGTWAGKKFQDLFGVADNQNIVMDEVVGVGLTCLLLSRDSSPYLWVAGFILFRLFDIVKIPPVGAVDRWSKGSVGKLPSAWRGGFGVMADDVVAGIQGLIVLEVITRVIRSS